MIIHILSLFYLQLVTFVHEVKRIEVREDPPPIQEKTMGTWYGEFNYHGTHTANGDKFKPTKEVTCAHRDLPLGSYVYLLDPDTGKSIWCEITDRGPYIAETPSGAMVVKADLELDRGESWHRDVDISIKAARELGVYDEGLFKVHIGYYKGQCRLRHRVVKSNEICHPG